MNKFCGTTVRMHFHANTLGPQKHLPDSFVSRYRRASPNGLQPQAHEKQIIMKRSSVVEHNGIEKPVSEAQALINEGMIGRTQPEREEEGA